MTNCIEYYGKGKGLIAHCPLKTYFSSGLSYVHDLTTNVQEDYNITNLVSWLIIPFSLSKSMSSISTSLSIDKTKRKKIMKAKFNKIAYAQSISESSNNQNDIDSLATQDYEFSSSDYSFHIQDTSGKVLSCSEVWYM